MVVHLLLHHLNLAAKQVHQVAELPNQVEVVKANLVEAAEANLVLAEEGLVKLNLAQKWRL